MSVAQHKVLIAISGPVTGVTGEAYGRIFTSQTREKTYENPVSL